MMREWTLKGQVAKVIVFPLPCFLHLFLFKTLAKSVCGGAGEVLLPARCVSCCFLLNNEPVDKSSELNGILFIHNRGRVEFSALGFWEYFGHFPARVIELG